MLSLISSIVLSVFILWLCLGALQALTYRLLQPVLLSIDPAQGSSCLIVWLALPPVSALLASYVLYSPDLAQWFVAGHCHTSQCLAHGPQSTLAVLPAALLTAWTLYSIVQCLRRQWLPARRLCSHLTVMGVEQDGFVTLASNQPMAFTLGWLKPKVYISKGMQSACSAEEINCIVYHEAAHRKRRDNLRLLTSRVLTAPLPQRWTQRALDDLKLCCEQACDSSAAERLSRESVAAALIRVTRLQQHCAPAGSLAFSGNHTRQRILSLLDEPQLPLANEKLFAGAAVTLLIIMSIINPLHRAVELLP